MTGPKDNDRDTTSFEEFKLSFAASRPRSAPAVPQDAMPKLYAIEQARRQRHAELEARLDRDLPAEAARRLTILLNDHPVLKRLPEWARGGDTYTWLKGKADGDVRRDYIGDGILIDERAFEESKETIDYFQRQADLQRQLADDPGIEPPHPPDPSRASELQPDLDDGFDR